MYIDSKDGFTTFEKLIMTLPDLSIFINRKNLSID